MKMVEEEHNQPKFSPKPIKFQEIVEDEEEDRISLLPDCLLLEILSRLPSTKDAIRTGTLCKRWKHIWTLVPTLIFEYYLPNDRLSYFISSVDKTLTQCRQLKLKKFRVFGGTSCGWFNVFNISCGGFQSKVNNWIRYAIRRNVEELDLNFLSLVKVSFDQYFFINTCFTDLTLSYCTFNPIGAISWKKLRNLSIKDVEIDENLIENIISGSPLLETLVLDNCYGYRRLNITSKSVKNLVLIDCYGYRPSKIVEIKAPNILSLTIKRCMFLWDILLVNVSSLVEANLDYTRDRGFPNEEEEEEMLKRFIQNLRHVKELKIGAMCLKVMSRLEAKGFVFPSNIKFPDGFYEG